MAGNTGIDKFQKSDHGNLSRDIFEPKIAYASTCFHELLSTVSDANRKLAF